MPSISVCLPAYNGERFICEAIESALAQSFADFEILVADDCSADRTYELVEGYAKRDSRIRLWRNEKNKGLFANYNECMNKASGQLIKLFAQDDVWHPEILTTMMSHYQKCTDAALIACSRAWIDSSGQEIELKKAFRETARMTGHEVIELCAQKFINWIGEPSTVMFPAKMVGTGFDTTYYHLGDLEYWFRLLNQGAFVYVDEVLCKFRRHAESTTNKNLTGLRFAIDMTRLADSDSLSQAIDIAPEKIKLRAMRNVASYVGYLHERGEMSVQALLDQQPADPEEAKRLLNEFKQLSFYALLAFAERENEWTARFDAKQRELFRSEENLAALLASKAWRSTEFVRGLARKVKPHRTSTS